MSTSTRASRRHSAIWLIAALAWMGVIFALSSEPDWDPTRGQRLHFGVYKVAHLVEYGILGGLVAGGMRTVNTRHARWWGWVVVVLYAIGDEIHQAFVPGRTPLVTDVAIDALGGLLGILAFELAGHIRDGQRLPSALARLLRSRQPPSQPAAMYADGPREEPT